MVGLASHPREGTSSFDRLQQARPSPMELPTRYETSGWTTQQEKILNCPHLDNVVEYHTTLLSEKRKADMEKASGKRIARQSSVPSFRPIMATAPRIPSKLIHSVSISELDESSSSSSPFPQQQTHRQQSPWSKRMATPSRIPTPTNGKGRPRGIRYATAPAALSPEKKENIPQRPTRLMGPISPTRNRPAQGISKSRTLGMLSSLTSSFSRSNLHKSYSNSHDREPPSSFSSSHPELPKSKSSGNIRPAAPPATALSDITASASTSTKSRSRGPSVSLPTQVPEHLQIHDAQPDGYWAGRFSSLCDRYGTEMIQETLNDPASFQKCVAPTPQGYIPPPRLTKDKGKSKSKRSTTSGSGDPLDSERLASSIYLQDNDEARKCKAFTTLASYCMTNTARHSLFEFQEKYARKYDNPRLLPAGGKMKDSFLTRLARGSNSDKKADRGTSMGIGRRAGLSRFGRSRIDLNNTGV